MQRRTEVPEDPPGLDPPPAPPVTAPAAAGAAGSSEAPHETAAPPAREPHRGDWLVARLPFFVAAGIGLYFALGAYALDIGSLRQPDAGLWPFIVAVLLVVFSVVGMFTASRDDIEAMDRTALKPLLGLIALGLFVVLFDELGLLLTASLVLTFWFRFLARESWRMSVALAVGASATAYLLFVELLGARLPADVIAQLWGGR